LFSCGQLNGNFAHVYKQVLKLYYEAYLVGVADHGDVDVGVPAYLLLWDDNLGRESVLRVWHGVIKEANASNNLAYLADTIGGVRRVAINLNQKTNKVLLLHPSKNLYPQALFLTLLQLYNPIPN
jgi:hypothetical protein